MEKNIWVSAAIVIDDGDILIAQRREDKKNALLWEFAGGKVEENETVKESLVREFKEEMDMDIKVGEFFKNEKFAYDFGTVSLDVFFAETLSGRDVNLTAHKQVLWVKPHELINYEFTPPDRAIVKELIFFLDK